MRKNYIIIILAFVITSSTLMNIGITPPITKAETDTYPPQITFSSASPQTVGFGTNITITSTVTDNQSGIQQVTANITYPDAAHVNQTFTHKEGTTYEYTFTDTWTHGWYNYTIWATDNSSNINSTIHHSFNITAYATVSIATLQDNYTANQTINLTDPPNPPSNLTLTGRGPTWNTYYNAIIGKNILETYRDTVNYQENDGTWQPINTTLTTLPTDTVAYTKGYTVGNTQGPYAVYFKPTTQDSWPVAFAYNRSTDPVTAVIRTKLTSVGYVDPTTWTTHTLQTVQNSQSQTQGDTITYPNVFTGTDITYTYQNTHLKEAIILSNTTKTLLQNHSPSQYGLGTNSYLTFVTKLNSPTLTPYDDQDQITGNHTATNDIQFKDALGHLACSLPIGFAYEQTNPSESIPLLYRIIHQNGDTYLLTAIPYTTLTTMTFPVVIDPTITIYTSTSDSFLLNSGTNYTNAWSATASNGAADFTHIAIGQKKVSTMYTIYRGYVFFNTSVLPSNAIIENASLSIYKATDYSTTDFKVTLQNGMPTYPHSPLVSSDYNKAHYTGNGGTLNTASLVNGYNNITLNTTGLSWINRTNWTKLCLRSNKDISGTTPTGNEYVYFYASEQGTNYKPKLTITYINQSKIKNTGTTTIKGYLHIQVQYYNESTWYVANDVINEDSPRTITVGNQLALDTIFNGQLNTTDIPCMNGLYRVYAAFCDPEGNPLVCNDNQILVGTHQFNLNRPCHGWRKLLLQDGFWQGSIFTSHNVATRGIANYTGELYVGTENLNKWKWNLLNGFNGFAAGTQITMADNSYQSIEDIQSGDTVKAYNMDTREYVNTTVQVIYQHTPEESPGYVLKINNILYASPNQFFLVNGVLKEARDIINGDILTDEQGKESVVSSIDNITNFGDDIYNFMIGVSPFDNFLQPNNLTFFAEGIEAYPWSSDGFNGSWGEAETMGVDLSDDLTTWGSEFTYKCRAEASDGCEIWKYNQSTQNWTPVINGTGSSNTDGGFGNITNWGAGEIKEFNGYIFVGTWGSPKYGCEIWRYNGSTWTNVVGRYAPKWGCGFGNPHNCAVTSMTEFKGHLYVGTMNFDWSNSGFCQVWRNNNSNCTDWVKVVDRGFRNVKDVGNTSRNAYAWRMVNFSGMLYVGTFNIPIPWSGDRGCELFRSGTGNSDDWYLVNLSGGNGFGEKQNYGIRGLVNWNNRYLYVGVAADFFQLYIPEIYTPEAIEIWRYDNTSWECIVGDSAGQPGQDIYDGFDSYYNKYPWSMAKCDNKLWIGTLNVQLLGNPHSYGCEIWYYDESNVTASVKNPEGPEHYEKPNGFGNNYTIATRSMIEFPKDSGRLVAGTVTLRYQFKPLQWEPGCEVWIHYP